ncbi:hypothetical protein QTP70_007265 [Hemibagrus guttatus]|uniref:Reverse transcriptase domain-containing protein n=1 Tax=Hemibagrus guttatus TaxID=175788 RepID=A0AAE0QRC8_9TELE|nr:hypothetical protein QTP70_007265 [Hemibagrus guttatus]
MSTAYLVTGLSVEWGGIGGSVVGFSPIMQKAWVRFPANASTPATGCSAGPKPGKIAYRPLFRRSNPVLKQVKTWPAGAISALQDGFECTDWNMFREVATNGDSINLEEYTTSVTSYISKCIDDVTVFKTITTRSNQKPWMTAEVRALLKLRDSAFRAGDKEALRTARAKLSQAIKEAKRTHAQRINGHFQDSRDSQRMWQGIQAITYYKTTPSACDSDASLPDVLNDFYAQFEAQNNVAARKAIPPPNDQVLCLSMADVKRTLCRVNPRKSAGPDNIPGRVLRECAEQLADVFNDIFNISLSSAIVPTCLKTTTIVPVLKKSSCLNDYSFNTIIPRHLFGKLSLLGLNTSLCNWILDFLTRRPQSVRIRNSLSSTTTLSTGAPQGCVLSPLLFTLLTHRLLHSSNRIVKFANDMTVAGLISKNDESAYREQVQCLTAWCKANSLSLNFDKTKEMVVDFRRAQSDHSLLFIDGSPVEIIKSTKFLGLHLTEDLTWSLNTTSISKKAQQRLYFLQILRKAHLPPPILTMFYRGTIESVLSNYPMQWIVRTAEKIIGLSLPSITDMYTTRCIRKANSIVDDPTHPSHTLFTLLPP